MAQDQGGARREREFDESKVKRNQGRFARTEGPRVTPGARVTNRRTGTSGRIVGRTADGYVVVLLDDGTRAKWRAESTQPARPALDEKGKKGAKGKASSPAARPGMGTGGKVGPGGYAPGREPEGTQAPGGRSGRKGKGKGKGGRTAAERRRDKEGDDLAAFIDEVKDEQAAAAREGRPARLYVGDKMGQSVARFQRSGLPVRRRADGTLEVDFPGGMVEVRPGSRLRADGATREEIDAEKAAEELARARRLRDAATTQEWIDALRDRPDFDR